MAYNRKNHLLKVKAVCELYERMHQPDVPMSVTYRKVIYPCFYISMGTFSRYLGIPYERELCELAEKRKPVDPMQYTLF